MIEKIDVINFKCLGKHTITCAPLTILAGANGSGKSSVIQALLLGKRADEAHGIQQKEIEINGPYNMNLGKVSDVVADQPIIDGDVGLEEISITFFYNLGSRTKIVFRSDAERSPGALQLSSFDGERFAKATPFRYLNAERIGPRRAVEIDSAGYLDVGWQGQHVLYALEQASKDNITINERLLLRDTPPDFAKQAEARFGEVIPDFRIELKPFFDVGMISARINSYIPPATGFGISFALPIIVAGLLASSKVPSTLIVENPEAHLHPFGQSRMGRFLAKLASIGVQVFVETHSEHIIHGASLELAEHKQAEKLVINFLWHEEKKVRIEPISLNNTGELSLWPPGFFDQEQQDLRDLMRLRHT